MYARGWEAVCVHGSVAVDSKAGEGRGGECHKHSHDVGLPPMWLCVVSHVMVAIIVSEL